MEPIAVKRVSMKVDLVIGSLQVGGAERQLVGLASAFHRMGLDVRVITLWEEGPLSGTLLDHGVSVVSLQGRDLLHETVRGATISIPLKLAALWRRKRPDVVQAWLSDAQVLALPVARLAGVPVRVMAIRSMASSVRMTAMKNLGLRLAARSCTTVIANSSAALADGDWPVDGIPAHAIPNAVDVPLTTADVTKQPAVGVMLANFRPVKGHEVLLQALSRLPSPPQMHLIGSGELLDHIKLRISQLNLGESIEIHEGVTDPWSVLLECQFAVLPSFTEGLPNAVLEAMAAGLPVVASRVGGIPELIQDGVEGYLIESGRVDELAQAIQKVAVDPEWRRAAGRQGRVRAEGLTWQAMAARNLDVMIQALELKRR